MSQSKTERGDKHHSSDDISMLQLQYNCKHYTVFDAIICIESLRRSNTSLCSQNVSEDTENL